MRCAGKILTEPPQTSWLHLQIYFYAVPQTFLNLVIHSSTQDTRDLSHERNAQNQIRLQHGFKARVEE